MAFATENVREALRNVNRAVVTQNQKDFIQLHRMQPNHAGIIVCTEDRDWDALALRIHTAMTEAEFLQGKLIRIVRPS